MNKQLVVRTPEWVGEDYFENNIKPSLESYWNSTSTEEKAYNILKYDGFTINDIANKDCMLQFRMLSMEPEAIIFEFLGRIKG